MRPANTPTVLSPTPMLKSLPPHKGRPRGQALGRQAGRQAGKEAAIPVTARKQSPCRPSEL